MIKIELRYGLYLLEKLSKSGVENFKVITTSKNYILLLKSSYTYAINYIENRSFLKVRYK